MGVEAQLELVEDRQHLCGASHGCERSVDVSEELLVQLGRVT